MATKTIKKMVGVFIIAGMMVEGALRLIVFVCGWWGTFSAGVRAEG